MEFVATLRDLRFQRRDLANIPWPKGRPIAYPPEANGVFEPQAYIDFAPQANGLVRPLSDKRLDAMVADIARRAGVSTKERPLPPSEVAYRVADVVFKQVARRGDGTKSSSTLQSRILTHRQLVPSGTPAPPPNVNIGLITEPDTFEGFLVRDVLTVWDQGSASQPERAAILVAALRRLQIPARVMLGVQLDQSDRDELLNPRAGLERRQQVRILPAIDPTGPDDPKCPNMPGRPQMQEITTTTISNPAVLVAWVEFDLYDRHEADVRMVWVPIDPGTGGGHWEFGQLENAENILAIATNFWPSNVQFVGPAGPSVGRFGGNSRYWNPAIADWHQPLALFGMLSQPSIYTTCLAEWRVSGRKTSVRELDEYVSSRRRELNGKMTAGRDTP